VSCPIVSDASLAVQHVSVSNCTRSNFFQRPVQLYVIKFSSTGCWQSTAMYRPGSLALLHNDWRDRYWHSFVGRWRDFT
jgi:hypothetical protein